MFLKKGEVLGFETDTVWGLGCLPNDCDAVDKIYQIKGRDRSKPLILMSNNLENLMPYVKNIPDYAKTLIEKHFPGALTLIFEKTEFTPSFITSGKNTVGIRIPDHAGFQKLCLEIEFKNRNNCGAVLATTSLNYSNEPPVKDFSEAYEKFGEQITLIKPENTCKTGVSSTVVLCTDKNPLILRQGNVQI